MKRLFVIILLVPIGAWLTISQIRYKMTKTYPAQQINPVVISWVERESSGKSLSKIYEICDFSNRIISEYLSYSYNVSVRNPNLAWKTKDVNCLGYAAMQTAVINQLLKRAGITDWSAEQHSCKIYCLGIWTGGYHSYPVLLNTKTKEKIVPDACMYDLIRVGYYKET